MPPKKDAYTSEEVDDLLSKFEKAAARVAANAASAVKLRSAERDLLSIAELSRDLMQTAVRDTSAQSRDLLKTVFGSDGCSRFHRFKNVMDGTEGVEGTDGAEDTPARPAVEFSDMHKDDQRWPMLKAAIKIIEQILEQLGMFKPWMLTAAPENLSYKGLRGRFSPGEKVKLEPRLTAGENLQFTIEPPLPEGLFLDAATGEVGGVLSPTNEVPMTDYIITAKNGGGEATAQVSFSVLAAPPHSLEYLNVRSCFTGEAIHFETAIEGGPVKEWTIVPELPQGLTIDQENGDITGTPMDPADKTDYTVTASNSGGEVTAVVNFKVTLAPPVSIAYPGASKAYPMGGVLYLEAEVELQSGERFTADDLPTRKVSRSGSVMSIGMRSRAASEAAGQPELRKSPTITMPKMEFSIEPDLPEGLTLAKSTGVISGKPKAPTPEQVYKVTVANAGGKVSVDLPLAILMIPPAELAFPDVAEQFFTGDGVTLTPSVAGGLVDKWTVSPALPEGLSLDEQMGTISGIPTLACPPGSWTVTAKNGVGEASTTLNFAVLDAAPTDLNYPNLAETGVYPVLRKLKPELTPTVAGLVKEFSVEPALPAGLTIDPRTGEISGMPTASTDDMDYIVTAKNDTGSCQACFSFATRVMPPAELNYPRLDDLYEVGENVDLEPEVEGGAESWTIEPALPAGLSFDTATGRISGAPTTTADEASYVVTASNEAGGTSTVLTFGVTAPPPAGLTYPGAADDYVVGGEDVTLEPAMERGVCCTFSVSPDLPGGLILDTATGIITGSPTEPAETATYTVTAANVAGSTSVDLGFSCSEVIVDQVDNDFASEIENITNLAELVNMAIDKNKTMSDWMVWMVHRAHLNDPTLTDFNFNNLSMPLPHLEPRVGPKLMKAMERNTYITSLQLCNSNMQKPDGMLLAKSLMANKNLLNLNIESNNLDNTAIETMATCLKESEVTKLETWRFDNQKSLGNHFGRKTEESLATMTETNHNIVKLGFCANDAHWRLVIDRNILRNIDVARRKRKKHKTVTDLVIPAEEKTLSRVFMKEAPDTPVWEIFEEDNEQLKLAKELTAKSKRLPTKEQIQANAKATGKPLKYAEVAPLVSTFRKKLFDVATHLNVMVTDAYNVEYTGGMRGWSEKNDKWAIDLWPEDDKRLNFTLNKQPVVELSDEFAEWLMPTEL